MCIRDRFGSESFFEIANSVEDTPGRDSWGYLLNWYGYQKGFVTQKYAEQMLADPGDVRGQLLEENNCLLYTSCSLFVGWRIGP